MDPAVPAGGPATAVGPAAREAPVAPAGGPATAAVVRVDPAVPVVAPVDSVAVADRVVPRVLVDRVSYW